ncbi:hypothetical protein [Psychromonas aquimarina]|uniref:hypothetical protein n=1 Tax=Psychromonas aquimarina TaxID=444919 RepID=UPI000404B9AD|nr:hypothetical protein [Psychromonas aquimarina]
MPNAGDNYTVTLKTAHMQWGTHRHTSTRGVVYGEGYIQIPASVARKLNIYNSNHPDAGNEYKCSSYDGFLTNVTLKACGSSSAGALHAKQFEGSGNLKLLGDWFHQINAQEGDEIEVSWISASNIIIRKI